MQDVCRRDPWGLRRLLGRHAGETGVVVYHWFNRLIGWIPAGGYELVVVDADGEQRAFLDQKKRGPAWISLPPGEHRLDFRGLDGPLRTERVRLLDHSVVLVAFKPPERIPFRRQPTHERWCVRRLR